MVAYRALESVFIRPSLCQGRELALRLAGRGEPGQGEPLGPRYQVICLQPRPVVGYLVPLVAWLRSRHLVQSDTAYERVLMPTRRALVASEGR